MKGLLVASGAVARRTHDLDALATAVAEGSPSLVSVLARLRPLTVWQSRFRYPTLADADGTGPGEDEIRNAIDDLVSLREAIREIEPA